MHSSNKHHIQAYAVTRNCILYHMTDKTEEKLLLWVSVSFSLGLPKKQDNIERKREARLTLIRFS